MAFAMVTDESFGQLLRRLRLRAGLTQQALADVLDTTNATVSNWEKDKHPPGDRATAQALADFFAEPRLLELAGYEPGGFDVRQLLEEQAATIAELMRRIDDLERGR